MAHSPRDQVDSTTELYLTLYDDAAVSAEAVATTFYRNRINLHDLGRRSDRQQHAL